jgi:MtN3 and saliva related transmembrane protein
MIGYIAGTLTTIAFAPQLIKCFRTESTKDVSLLMLICSTSGMALWLIHGLIQHDNALVIANTISVALASTLLVYKLKNDRSESRI